MTAAIAMGRFGGLLSRLGDIVFGRIESIEPTLPAESVAITLSGPDGSRETVWVKGEPGTPAFDQADHVLVLARKDHAGRHARVVGLALSEAADRRWVARCRDAFGRVSEIAVMASDERDAEMRARFAAVTEGREPVLLEDALALHELGEEISLVVVTSLREEALSYEDFRDMVRRMVAGLREGKTFDQSGMAEVEDVLSRFPR